MHQLRKQKQRRWRRTQYRLFRVADHVEEDPCNILLVAVNRVVLRPEKPAGFQLVASLIEGRIFNPTEKVRSRCPASLRTSAAMTVESSPPLRYAPTGTSDRSRSRVASVSSARKSSASPSACSSSNSGSLSNSRPQYRQSRI